jgi:hypothetical protein
MYGRNVNEGSVREEKSVHQDDDLAATVSVHVWEESVAYRGLE